jgi:hypothetical protein
MLISKLKALPYEHPLDENGKVLSQRVKKVQYLGEGYFIKQRSALRGIAKPYEWPDCEEVEVLAFFKGLGVFEELLDHDGEDYVVKEIKGERLYEFMEAINGTRGKMNIIGRVAEGYQVDEIVADLYAKMLYTQMVGVFHGESTVDNIMVERKRNVRFIDVEKSGVLDKSMLDDHDLFVESMVADLSYWTMALENAFGPFKVENGFSDALGKEISKIHHASFDIPLHDRREYLWHKIKEYMWGLYGVFEDHGFPEELTNKVFAKYIVLAALFIDEHGEFLSGPFDLDENLWNQLKESSILIPFLSLALESDQGMHSNPGRVDWYRTNVQPHVKLGTEGTLEQEIIREVICQRTNR